MQTQKPCVSVKRPIAAREGAAVPLRFVEHGNMRRDAFSSTSPFSIGTIAGKLVIAKRQSLSGNYFVWRMLK
jgi:hypothetical protein